MCGIAAFSKPEGSKTNARHLAHHLLTQIENRGSHASGFSYINPDGEVGIYKNPHPGSQLSLHELPRDARTVILHTRYATQGSPRDNRNNHPVISTDNRIALVHNGVISNDGRLRGELGITSKHGEVDSLVIPSLIAQHGVEGLSRLSGYAAIAWLDTDKPSELHIAKLKNSPVAYTNLFDGTFVMASTPALLEGALIGAGLQYGGVFELAETRMITVIGGFIMNHDRSPSMSYDYGSYRRYSSATAGGHGTATRATGRATAGSEDTPRVVIPGPEDADDELAAWRAKRNAEDAQPMVLSGVKDGWTDEDWDEYVSLLEERDGEDYSRHKLGTTEEHESCTVAYQVTEHTEGFYMIDSDGNISHYSDLEKLETQLAWLAQMSRTEADMFDVEDKLNWINHIMDIGHVEEDGDIISWVDDSAEVDEFESPLVHNLAYIKEGTQRLSTLKGA